MKERKTWNKEEDDILKLLKQIRGEKKWSTIAKKMEEQFSIAGRSGKQCRQRYHNHLDSTIKQTEWTTEQEKVLYEMHEEVGNRWSVISHHLPGRTDNGIKNHFYSKLRKAVRRINKIICENYKKEYKEIKTSLLYKLIETSESKFKVSSMIDEQVADYCSEIKNKLYYFEQNFNQNDPLHIQALKILVQDILNFGKNDKKVKVRHRKCSGTVKDLLHPNMYLQKARSNSEYSSSEFSSKGIDSSSYCEQSDEDQNISIGHKSMINIPKEQSNPSKSCTSNTNLRLTRSRSKEETYSSVKSPGSFSDDSNAGQKLNLHAFTGDNFLNSKIRSRNPSFAHEKSEWNPHDVEQILMAENVLEQKSSDSNKLSRNSRSNSINRSHVSLFFQDSHFEMRILSPKNFPQDERMSEEEELFHEYPMEIQFQIDRYSIDSVKTLNLGKEIHKLTLEEEKLEDQQKKSESVNEIQNIVDQKPNIFKFFSNQSNEDNQNLLSSPFQKDQN